MKPLISVLVPTRKRVPLLRSMMQSLLMTASESGNQVEVIARLDFDDDETLEYLRDWRWGPFIVGPRYDGYATLAMFINEAARLSTANLLIVVNDDVEFKTKDWDVKLVEAAMQFPDGIFNLGVDTVLNNENFVFPCVSRRVVDLLGCFFDPRLVYPDIWLRDVMMLFGRAARVPEVVIEHAWAGQSEDQVQAGRKVHGNAAYAALYAQCVEEGREKVRCALTHTVNA